MNTNTYAAAIALSLLLALVLFAALLARAYLADVPIVDMRL